MPTVTRYQLWQHSVSRELWVVRVELDTLTGLHGPVPSPSIPDASLADLPFEEHPDDLEWIFRASDHFKVLKTVEVG
jgi:hypothetical protein